MESKVLKVVLTAYIVITALMISATGAPQDKSTKSHPLDGSYNVIADNPGANSLELNLKLKKTEDKWNGEMSSPQFMIKVTEVTIDAENNIIMKCDTDTIGSVVIKGKFANDKFKGTWEGGGTIGTWEAVKKNSDQ